VSRGAIPEAPPARCARLAFDARDQIAVGFNDANAFARIEEPQIGAFADRHGGTEREDAGKGTLR